MDNIALIIKLKIALEESNQTSTPFMSDAEWDAHLYKEFHDVCIESIELIKKYETN